MTMMQEGEALTMPEFARGPIELEGEALIEFTDRLTTELRFADSERQSMVNRANKAERHYNLDDNSDPIYADQEFIHVPASVSRVDRVAAELSGAFDRDGSPIFVATPTTPSMVELSQHAERMIHDQMRKTDAIRHLRTTIKRAVKVGTGVLCTEVVSRELMSDDTAGLQDDEGATYENALVVRSIKVQDMIVTPMNISDLSQAAFVGERFLMPQWMYSDAISSGFYEQYVDDQGNSQIPPGYFDDAHGATEENRRLGITASTHGRDSASDFYDLVRGYMRFRGPEEAHHSIYYVVFPMGRPQYILHLKKTPYQFLDRTPYTFWTVDEGDGSIFGRGYMELLEDLQAELNDLHQLRVATTRRSYANIYVTRKGSAISDAIKARRGMPDPDTGEIRGEGAAKEALIYADEVFESENPQTDIVALPMTQQRGGYSPDESIVQQYMDMATVDSSPLQGIRTAFEVRQAASEASAKLKQYLKVIAATGLRPAAEIMKAQIWEFLMPISELDDNYRWMEYGDVSQPINKTDFFNGFTLEPAGTTTSADEMVAITNTASLVSELIPLIIQVPGVVPDPAKSVREILKARARALGMEQFESVFGLREPTPQEMEKAMLYRQMVMGASQPKFQMPSNVMGAEASMTGGVMGGNGGAVQGAPDPTQGGALAAPAPAAEMDGGNVM